MPCCPRPQHLLQAPVVAKHEAYACSDHNGAFSKEFIHSCMWHAIQLDNNLTAPQVTLQIPPLSPFLNRIFQCKCQ